MRSDKDFEKFGREVWEKCKEYASGSYLEVDLDDLMEMAIKNNLCVKK